MGFTGRTEEFLNSIIENNGFFPEFSVGEFQRIYNVPVDQAEESVTHQLKMSINLVNDQLKDDQVNWLASGYADLAAAGEGQGVDYLTYYFTAVSLRTKAELLVHFESFSRKNISEGIADSRELLEQAFLADSNVAVRRLKGIGTNITAGLL